MSLARAPAQTRRATAPTPESAWTEVAISGRLGGLIGASRAFRPVRNAVVHAARLEDPVLIRGPAGAGKLAVAQAIHTLSGRAGHLAVLHCAAIPSREHLARLVDGQGGAPPLFGTATTVLLREVEALAPSAQAALLARLETSGAPTRVLASTRLAVATTALAPAFYYRLAMLTVDLPTLADRGVDIEIMADAYLESRADRVGRPWALTSAAHATLRDHTWPGNVRELHHVLEQAMHRADRSPIGPDHLPAAFGVPDAPIRRLDALERAAVEAALAEVDGNVTEAGRRLGVPRSTLYRKLKKWGVR
jgi:DNA-binding NtrC family response regulator